jgi:DNA-binding phage protein
MARRRLPDTPPDPKNDPPGRKLSRLIERKGKGRALADIAESAGMKRSALSRMMSDDGPSPRIDTLQRVLDAIGATLSDYEKA